MKTCPIGKMFVASHGKLSALGATRKEARARLLALLGFA